MSAAPVYAAQISEQGRAEAIRLLREHASAARAFITIVGATEEEAKAHGVTGVLIPHGAAVKRLIAHRRLRAARGQWRAVTR